MPNSLRCVVLSVRRYKYLLILALQDHSSCWCGTQRHLDASPGAGEGDCNNPCAGNGGESCGGGFRNSVYRSGFVPCVGVMIGGACCASPSQDSSQCCTGKTVFGNACCVTLSTDKTECCDGKSVVNGSCCDVPSADGSQCCDGDHIF
jgi:hypothetical protein